MRSYRPILASVLPWRMADVGYQSGVLNDPRHWNVSPDFGVSESPIATAASASRLAAAQAKRDRKAAKRLRDAKGGGDA